MACRARGTARGGEQRERVAHDDDDDDDYDDDEVVNSRTRYTARVYSACTQDRVRAR